MSDSSSRAEFEAWWKTRQMETWSRQRISSAAPNPPEGWEDGYKPHALQGWQAARMQPQQQAEPVANLKWPYKDGVGSPTPDQVWSCYVHEHRWRHNLQKEIEILGRRIHNQREEINRLSAHPSTREAALEVALTDMLEFFTGPAGFDAELVNGPPEKFTEFLREMDVTRDRIVGAARAVLGEQRTKDAP
jgi:hypothetical protein